jgi:transposase-like protein
MNSGIVVRYSLAFRRQVVADLEEGRFVSIEAARLHYGIGGMQTVKGWLRLFGKNHLIPKVVRVEKPDEKDQIRQLKRQVQELQRVLGKAHVRGVLNEEFLRMACEQLGQDVESFKKKVAAKQGTPPASEQG